MHLRMRLGERTDDVIRLDPFAFIATDAAGIQKLSGDRELDDQFLIQFLPRSLVIGIHLVAEGRFARIPGDHHPIRFDLCQRLLEHRHETEDRVGRDPVARLHHPSVYRGIICPKQHGVTIQQKQFFHRSHTLHTMAGSPFFQIFILSQIPSLHIVFSQIRDGRKKPAASSVIPLPAHVRTCLRMDRSQCSAGSPGSPASAKDSRVPAPAVSHSAKKCYKAIPGSGPVH